MDGDAADFERIEGLTPPYITPPAERRRLVAKGQRLAAHCLESGSTACVLGFVEHCLGRSPPQLDVVVALWRALRRDAGSLDPASCARLRDLLAAMAARIAQALGDGASP
jgi:hypothetical protein